MKITAIILSRLSVLIIMILALNSCSPEQPVISFTTAGHTAYQVSPATVSKNSGRAIVAAAYDGYVTCHTYKGKLLWELQPGKGFPFDLEVTDIDNDGLDETMVASSDGTLYVIDNNGKLMWTFGGHPLPPLYQVAVEKDSSGVPVILTGGIERVLYTLSADGKVLDKKENRSVIRYLPLSKGNQTDNRYSGEERTIRHNCTDVISRPYKMDFTTHIKSPTLGDEYMITLSGRNLIIYNLDGSCRKVLHAPLSFTGTAFDEETNIFWFGSEISGGDGIYGVRLDNQGWEEAFTGIRPVGKIAEMEKNMQTLLRQVEAFQPLSYQKKPEKTMIVIEESADWDYDQMLENIKKSYIEPYKPENIYFVPYVYSHENQYHFKEYYDPGIKDPKFRAEWERFHSGAGRGSGAIGSIKPKEEIIQFAKDREKAGEDFFIFAAHGRPYGIDFYFSPETLAEMLMLAPNTFKGFIVAELERTDEVLEKAIKEQLLPLADLCYENGRKKIFILNKNIFWNGSIYLDIFKPLMADEKYRETFVPCMEETNSRNQSLSLAGRTGLWLTGKFNHIAGKVVSDNPNFNRLWEWCQTEHLSHFLRAMALKRLLGADMFFINMVTDNAEELLPFYLMLEKGILPLPGKNDILSLSDLTIGIKTPDNKFIEHGMNGHGMSGYSPDEGQFVFDRLDCYWGGALIPEHDFENYALGAKRRMTNFISRNPYGNLTTISAETDISQFPYFRKMLQTDGRLWYDDKGKTYTAEEYKPAVMKELEESAQRLPLRVYGDVAWVAIRIDDTHIRLVILDPGYLDPDDREAEIVFQHINPVEVKDILSGEILQKDSGGKVKVKIPLGILRVLDIEHKI